MLTPEAKKRRAELMRQVEATRESTYLESRGEYHAAFKRVAELFHCRESLPDEVREFVNEKISELRGHPERVSSIVRGYMGDRDRLAHILSIGEQFNGDEMLSVAGLRHRLELGNQVLSETGLGSRIETADVDELIDHCLGSSSNRIGFQRAVRAAKCAGAGWANLSNKDLRARRRKSRTRQRSGG